MNSIRMTYCRLFNVLIIILLFPTLIITILFTNTQADITKQPVWLEGNGLPTVYIANENSIEAASILIWDTPQNIFDYPIRVDMFQSDGGVKHFLTLDRTQNNIRYFGTVDDVFSFFKNFTSGPQLSRPMGLAVQPNQTESDYHKVYILDTGNNTIRAYDINKNNYNINYLGILYDDDNNGWCNFLSVKSGSRGCF